MSLYTVKSIFVLDMEGKRICCKYYTDDYPTTKEQQTFEKKIFDKTHKNPTGEILLWENAIIVYRNTSDVFFYVTGGVDENELILANVLNAIFETFSMLLRNQVDKRTMLENLDYVFLALDELVDKGVILESEPSIIASRVSMKGLNSDIPLSEQTISQALQTAKDQIARSILKSGS